MRRVLLTSVSAMLMSFAPALADDKSEPVTLVVVKKSAYLLELHSNERIVATFPVALGAQPLGHKAREGDERTPEGRYVLDWRNSRSGYHRAIHLSYPNAEDVSVAKAAGVNPGGMIMIHGQKNYFGWAAPVTQLFNWTNGCIAVRNEDMDAIWDSVPNGTPIEIRP